MGAQKTGGSTRRAKDSAAAGRLAAAPVTWRKHASAFPYHNNLGTTHTPPSGVIPVRKIDVKTKNIFM